MVRRVPAGRFLLLEAGLASLRQNETGVGAAPFLEVYIGGEEAAGRGVQGHVKGAWKKVRQGDCVVGARRRSALP
eukprot:5098836-Pleurochrysis_carterae.AAC.2